MSNRQVGVVIPARNEERHLPGVLGTVLSVDWLSQVIVVDDNSTDNTLEISRDFTHQDDRLSVLHLDRSSGKSRALLAGVHALQDRIDEVIFMDADLIGMQTSHIDDLYKPLGSNQCQMAVAVFRSGGLRTTAAQISTPNLSGQRCMRRSVAFRALNLLENSGYGVEIGLTIYARRNKWKIVYVPWWGVTHLVQESKHGLLRGLQARSVMYAQVIATWLQYRKDEHWLHPITRPRPDLDDSRL
jgi:glycosyltransferase involved in cell wall biosynthesis